MPFALLAQHFQSQLGYELLQGGYLIFAIFCWHLVHILKILDVQKNCRSHLQHQLYHPKLRPHIQSHLLYNLCFPRWCKHLACARKPTKRYRIVICKKHERDACLSGKASSHQHFCFFVLLALAGESINQLSYFLLPKFYLPLLSSHS